MKLTKYTHACVKLERDGKVLLIDPGSFTEDAAFERADAILVTHEHPDHVDADRVRSLDAPIFSTAGVAAALALIDPALGEQVTVVAGGDVFDAAGFAVRAYGNDHAIVLPELGVPCQNVGYLVEDAVYHPGDSFTRPDRAVHTNLTPVSGPWYSVPAAVEYVRAVDAQQTLGIHDALLSPIGQNMMKHYLDGERDRPHLTPTLGEPLEIG